MVPAIYVPKSVRSPLHVIHGDGRIIPRERLTDEELCATAETCSVIAGMRIDDQPVPEPAERLTAELAWLMVEDSPFGVARVTELREELILPHALASHFGVGLLKVGENIETVGLLVLVPHESRRCRLKIDLGRAMVDQAFPEDDAPEVRALAA